MQPLSSTQSARAPSSPPASASQRDREVEAFDAASVAASTATTVTSSQLSLESFRLARNKHPGQAKRALKRTQEKATSNTMSKQQRTMDQATLEEFERYRAAIRGIPYQAGNALNLPSTAITPPSAAPSANTTAAPSAAPAVTAPVATSTRPQPHAPQPHAPQPRIVYTKLGVDAANGPASVGAAKAALLVTLHTLDGKSSTMEQRLRQRALNTIGKYKSSVQQQQRAWSEFVMAVLDETKNAKLVKELLRTPQLPTQLSSYRANPFAAQEVESTTDTANAMDLEAKASGSTTQQRRRFTPRAFFKDVDAAFATSHAVYAVAHFRQPSVLEHVANQLHQALRQAGVNFLRLEKHNASTEYLSIKFSYEFDESKPFESEIELLRQRLEKEALLKDFHFDQRALDRDFFDPISQRFVPQLYVAQGNEAALNSAFFAGRDLEVFVQPATPCFSCAEIYTAALSHRCPKCTQSARQRTALQENAAGAADATANTYCFKCCKRVPSTHIGRCENRSFHCLRCNSSQHHTLQCPLLRRRFVPLSETRLPRGSGSTNSSGRDTRRWGLVPLAASQHAQPAAATSQAASNQSWARLAAGPQTPSPPLSDRQSPSASAPTSAGIDALRQEIRAAVAEDLQPFLQAFQQQQQAFTQHLLEKFEQAQTTAKPAATDVPVSATLPVLAADAHRSPGQFDQQARLSELTDAVRALTKQVGNLQKKLDERDAEIADLRQQLAAPLSTHLTDRQSVVSPAPSASTQSAQRQQQQPAQRSERTPLLPAQQRTHQAQQEVTLSLAPPPRSAVGGPTTQTTLSFPSSGSGAATLSSFFPSTPSSSFSTNPSRSAGSTAPASSSSK